MANKFVDLVGGNDANNGSTFALRKKTLSSAAAVAAAGDVIRVMGKPSTNSGTARGRKDHHWSLCRPQSIRRFTMMAPGCLLPTSLQRPIPLLISKVKDSNAGQAGLCGRLHYWQDCSLLCCWCSRLECISAGFILDSMQHRTGIWRDAPTSIFAVMLVVPPWFIRSQSMWR